MAVTPQTLVELLRPQPGYIRRRGYLIYKWLLAREAPYRGANADVKMIGYCRWSQPVRQQL
jgi:hypothetical protein